MRIPSLYQSGRPRCTTAAALRARWTVHARFGHRAETAELLREWVETVASQARGNLQGANISFGSIGAPECELQVDLDFGSLSDVDEFWNSLPQQDHRAWLQRMQGKVSDQSGTPAWTVYHVMPCTVQHTSQSAAQSTEGLPAAVPGNGVSRGGAVEGGAEGGSEAAFVKALTAELTHPATSPPPSLLDLPVADLGAGGSESSHQAQEPRTGGAGEAKQESTREQAAPRAARASGPVRVVGGLKIPAGGAPAGSRLAAMVGDDDYYTGPPGSTSGDS